MNLQHIGSGPSPFTAGSKVNCYNCGLAFEANYGFADLDGPPFKAYYCPECAVGLPIPAAIKEIHVDARRWFDRRAGNTYLTAACFVDGERAVNVPFCYGYGDHYMTEATEALEDAGYLPGLRHYHHGGTESLWRYCEERGIKLTSRVEDVERRSDLHNNGR